MEENRMHYLTKYIIKIEYKLLLVSMFSFAYILSLNAQQTPLYSQYVMSSFLINPAIAGANGYNNINLISHNQWVGISDAPRTNAISFQTRLMKSSWMSSNTHVQKKYASPKRSGQVGMGGYIFNDKNGHYKKTGIQYAYAYHLYVGPAQLSFGLAATLFQSSINVADLKAQDATDEVLLGAAENNYINDYDVGAYFLHPDFFIGLSVSQLAQGWVSYADRFKLIYDDKMFRNYQILAGYYYAVNEDIKIEPSVLLKTPIRRNIENGEIFLSMQLDASIKLYNKKGWWTGITYRTKDAVMIFGGVNVDRIFLGYAIDYPLNDLRSGNYGTHEITVAVKLGDNTRKYKYWDRY